MQMTSPRVDDPATKNALTEVATPVPVRCPLGMSIDARSDEVYSMTLRVSSLLDRLAL